MITSETIERDAAEEEFTFSADSAVDRVGYVVSDEEARGTRDTQSRSDPQARKGTRSER